MRLELIDGAGKAWHQLWSNRFAAVAVVLEVINQLASLAAGVWPWPWLSWLATACMVGAAIARMFKQPKLRRKIEDAKPAGK